MHPTAIAIISLAILEVIALFQGIDGVLFSLVVAAISGLGGFEVKQRLNSKSDTPTKPNGR